MDVSSYVEGWRKRAEEEKRRVEARRARLREALRGVAEALAREFPVTRVFWFGSWCWGRPHSRSDIDLAVEGLPAVREIKAAVRAERLLLERDPNAHEEVDLKRWEELPDRLRTRILEKGTLLHAEK